MSSVGGLRVRRSLLFTPGNRPSAFEKGLASGVDCLCIDLEDAVPISEKDTSRQGAVAFLADRTPGPERVLRINALTTRVGLDDLSAIARVAPDQGVILLPKVASAGEVCIAASVMEEAGSAVHLAALIESAEGLAAAEEIAASSPRLAFLLFGAIDLSADLGCGLECETMRTAKSRVIMAAKAAGIEVLDVPELGFRDLDRVTAAAQTARDNGFTGKAAIHPSNIGPINAAFTPSVEEIAEAKKIVAAYEASPNGLAVIDGRLVERPIVRAMERRLALAAAAGV